MGLVVCGVASGVTLRSGAGARAGGVSPAVSPSTSPARFGGFVDTRPVSGPSFAGNRAYLEKMQAEGARWGIARRETSGRPVGQAIGRTMKSMPDVLSSRLPSAPAERSGLRRGERSGR